MTTLTNKHTPATTEATVKKVWDDANNQDGIRPAESLTVTLSERRTEVTLNEANNGWTATIEDLPKYANGEEIDYTWTEEDLPGGVHADEHSERRHRHDADEHPYAGDDRGDGQEGLGRREQPGRHPSGEPDGDPEQRRHCDAERGEQVDGDDRELPKYANGEEIDYTWTEAALPEGYELTEPA